MHVSTHSATLVLSLSVCIGYAQLFRPPNLRPLLVGVSLMLFQQITGQPSVLYFAATIFQRAGFASATEATKTAVVLGIFKLLMTGKLDCLNVTAGCALHVCIEAHSIINM